ncbi:sensor histidine kinase [Phytoactinopolyspora halotolerans]|uniref:histidine kinase n=1 Tax=Phytoactinopolyspora halotolerans TaxID=1981512 RepID=A0A6L9SCR6_9ACTN|nr:HAMP domain-containing sensor histidine kinase [Phytoactinopolyspora halotolerans]NEE02877.1 HAMP domain-containing histidine kinase [Phytoactinopolyspora halotolerans]
MSGNGASLGEPEPTRADRRLLRRASAVVAVQTGVAAALVVAVVIVLVYSISQQERRESVEHKAEREAAELLGKMRDPDNRTSMGTSYTDVNGLAADDDCPQRASDGGTESWADDLPAGSSEIELCDQPFLAYVAEADGLRSVAAFSLVEQREETERLARLSMLAGGIGVLGAAALGWLVGRKAVRPLGRALSSQRRFVADASHELRTPLAILHTRAQLLQRGPATDDDQRRELDQLVDDARVLSDIVNDLLLSAEMQHRPDAGQPVDLAQVAAEIKGSFGDTADEAGVDLVLDVDMAAEHIVTGAPSALRRAVSALVDNSLRHADQDGTVTIRLNGTADAVRLSVQDDGEGFDPQLAAELRRRFGRGPDSSPDGHRLGLGLALVEEVVQAHEGAMEIDGRPGVGASVTLTFPRRASSR